MALLVPHSHFGFDMNTKIKKQLKDAIDDDGQRLTTRRLWHKGRWPRFKNVLHAVGKKTIMCAVTSVSYLYVHGLMQHFCIQLPEAIQNNMQNKK